jgi:hypothetical protein
MRSQCHCFSRYGNHVRFIDMAFEISKVIHYLLRDLYKVHKVTINPKEIRFIKCKGLQDLCFGKLLLCYLRHWY